MSETDNTAELLEAELQAQKQKLKEQKAAEKRQKKARNQMERAKRKTDRSKARAAARAAAPGRMVIVLNGRPVEARIVQRPDTIVGTRTVAPVRTGAVQARSQVHRPAPYPLTPGSVNMPRASRNIDGMPKVGDTIRTPRFLNVEVNEVFPSVKAMREAGYTEPCHMWDHSFECYGRHNGKGTWSMDFAVAPKDAPRANRNVLSAKKPSQNKAPTKKKTSSNAKKAPAKAKPKASASKRPTTKNTQGKKSNNSAPSKKPATKR